ncbi:hypothetical protein RRG08_062753 [Elysia crispata]|uniref:Uncharacterized protein n=1 Tax=Elysia crispata TaxID=231223 RepID=A0AAE1AIZ7_9GAST|nr:hypothetical protein RRG08_062753 [Elysia crispata]
MSTTTNLFTPYNVLRSSASTSLFHATGSLDCHKRMWEGRPAPTGSEPSPSLPPSTPNVALSRTTNSGSV